MLEKTKAGAVRKAAGILSRREFLFLWCGIKRHWRLSIVVGNPLTLLAA